MNKYYRTIFDSVTYYLGKYPVLAITGPRQSGKTTFLKNMFPDFTYLNLENPDVRNFVFDDPRGFFEANSGKLILDEVQRAPHLFSYIQARVDDMGQMGQYILSGSQNFHLMENITQSLAGRVALFRLLPMDFDEMQKANLLSDDFVSTMIKGFYPAIYNRDIPSKVFYSNYIQTYVERDISDLVQVRDLSLFRKFVKLCAARVGQILNLNSLANDCGITQPTAKSWLTLLETSYVVYLLYPYHENFNKRIVKSPKLFFFDTGLAAHLCNQTDADSLRIKPFKGHLFENMVITEIIKQNEHLYKHKEFWFWRDSAGHEIDLLILGDDKIKTVEIKATETIMGDLFNGLHYFENLLQQTDKSCEKYLIYGGDSVQKRTYVTVLPWKKSGEVML